MEEHYGKLAMANILTSIWMGNWDRYEEIMNSLPETVKKDMPFHFYYNRDEVKLWHDNHFFIPGEHFVSPYFSSYSQESDDEEVRKRDLLCLIGLFEKTGFYFPLEMDRFPDHFGCLTGFLSSVVQEQIKAMEAGDVEYLGKLEELENDVLNQYILAVIDPFVHHAKSKIQHPFFKSFLSFYALFMEKEWTVAA